MARFVFARAWPSAPTVQAVGELHAAELAFEHAARRVDWHGAQQFALLDARVALGAVAKGRSSTWPFLRILRRVAALRGAVFLRPCPFFFFFRCCRLLPARLGALRRRSIAKTYENAYEITKNDPKNAIKALERLETRSLRSNAARFARSPSLRRLASLVASKPQ